MTYADPDYLDADFIGPCESEIRCRTTKMVKIRRDQICCCVGVHVISAGSKVRAERALVDGQWGTFYSCLPCMDSWLDHIGPRRAEFPPLNPPWKSRDSDFELEAVRSRFSIYNDAAPAEVGGDSVSKFHDFGFPPLDIHATASAIAHVFREELRKVECRTRREHDETLEFRVPIVLGGGCGYTRIVEILTQFDASRTLALEFYKGEHIRRLRTEPQTYTLQVDPDSPEPTISKARGEAQ